MAACMDLIDRQEYYGWKLPKGVTIVLSCNPSDGDYFTAQQDQAQSTRYFNFGFKFDINSWVHNAAREGVDGRCQNFFLRYHKEVMYGTDSKKNSSKLQTNPRQWGKLFDIISGFPDFESSLAEIQLYGKGIVGDHINTFTTFIGNRLDKLIEPSKLMDTTLPLKSVLTEAEACIGTKKLKNYAPEIASIITTRLSTHLIHHLDDNKVTDDFCERLEEICKSGIFGNDLNFKLFRDVFKEHSTKFGKLITRPYFAETMLKG